MPLEVRVTGRILRDSPAFLAQALAQPIVNRDRSICEMAFVCAVSVCVYDLFRAFYRAVLAFEEFGGR